MPAYNYIALKNGKDIVKGQIEALNQRDARSALREKGLIATKIYTDEEKQDVSKFSDEFIHFLNRSKTEREAVEKAINALPPTPTQEDVPAVKAARELYDAYVAEWNDYTTLWANRTNPSEEAVVAALYAGYAPHDFDSDYANALESYEVLLGLNAAPAYANVEALKITAKSVAKKGYIKVSWTVKGENDADGYQVYKSTKANKGFKKAFTTTKKTYKNTKGLKKGTKYYYKVRAYKVVDGVTYYSDWSNKAYRVAK